MRSISSFWLLILTSLLMPAVTLGGAEPDLRPSAASERKAIRRVVEAQLAAWRGEDFPRAYALAASAIRTQFPLPGFVAMVRKGYPEIAFNTRAEMGPVVDNGRTARMSVRVFGRDGRVANVRYLFVRENNEWRISGVVGETRPLNDV